VRQVTGNLGSGELDADIVSQKLVFVGLPEAISLNFLDFFEYGTLQKDYLAEAEGAYYELSHWDGNTYYIANEVSGAARGVSLRRWERGDSGKPRVRVPATYSHEYGDQRLGGMSRGGDEGCSANGILSPEPSRATQHRRVAGGRPYEAFEL
jgi:hypothetical protein